MSTQKFAPTFEPVQVLYCGVCSFPPEYCSFGSHATKCKSWLQKSHPDLFSQLYGSSSSEGEVENISEATAGLTLEQKEALEKAAAQKEKKADAKEEREREKRDASKVTIKRIARNKTKFVTVVHGLEVFDIDLKKASKLFAQKFATGASVSKNAQGDEEITIQGDVGGEVMDLLLEEKGKAADVLGNGKIPEDNIVMVDEGKKKGGN